MEEPPQKALIAAVLSNMFTKTLSILDSHAWPGNKPGLVNLSPPRSFVRVISSILRSKDKDLPMWEFIWERVTLYTPPVQEEESISKISTPNIGENCTGGLGGLFNVSNPSN